MTSMEKSMSGSVEPVQGLNSPLVFTTVCGFSLYWACLFTMLMRNSFMDGDIEVLWYHFFLRIAFLAGCVVMFAGMTLAIDFLSTQRGVRLQRAGVFMFSFVAIVSSLIYNSTGTPMPVAFDCVAWGLAGVGLTCLFMPWTELMGSLTRREKVLAIAGAVALGACLYLVMNMLPFPFNIALLCICPLGSLAVVVMLEHSDEVVPAPFVPRMQSLENVKLTFSFKAMTVAYGVVLGLGIGLTTQIQGGAALYSGIAGATVLGVVAAVVCLRFGADRVQQNGAFQILFPVLIIALLPMSFLQGLPATVCNMLVFACFAIFEITGMYLMLFLSERHKASRLQLACTLQACLFAGLLVGHVIGVVATSSGVMDYPMLSGAALALVVMLAVMVTLFGIGPVDRNGAIAGRRGAKNGDESREGKDASGCHEHGRWKTCCETVAREHGLSARETEVFMLLAKGRGIEHIQGKLCISGHTVKSHVYNIYRKMDINSREELLDAVENAREVVEGSE